VTSRRPQRILLTIVRWLVAVIPVVWIFSRIDLARLAITIRQVAWWTVPVLVVLLLAGMFLQGLRWWMLLRAYLPSLPFGRVLASHFAALYYSIVLPTSGAQDVVRAMLIAKDNDYGVVWGASVVSRMLGAIVLVGMALFGLFSLASTVVPHVQIYAILSAILIVAVVFAAFSKRVTRPLRALLAPVTPARLLKIGERVRDGIYHFRSKRAVLFRVFLVTLLMQFVVIATTAFLAFGITGQFRLIAFLAFIPVIETICISLPLTPGGLGVREGLLAIMFHVIGYGTETLGVYIALMYIGFILRLAGIFALPFLKKREPVSSVPASGPSG
jgi:uncharacterized protein (TIRG00374 family)